MKTKILTYRFFLPTAAVTLLAWLPLTSSAQDAPVVIESSGNTGTKTVVVPGGASPEAISAEEEVRIREMLRKGVMIPEDMFARLQEVPTTVLQTMEVKKELVYRFSGGMVYAIEPTTYRVVDVMAAPETISVVDSDPLPPEEMAAFRKSLVKGYAIPKERYVILKPVPEVLTTSLDPLPEGVEYRYLNDTVYTVDVKTYRVVDVTTIAPNGKVTETRKVIEGDSTADFQKSLVKGYVVSKDKMTILQEVPATVVTTLPAVPENAVYRYLNGIVYAIDPNTGTILEAKSVEEITAKDR